MLVIIEGPDGSGKTTLCKKLKENGCIALRRERGYNWTIGEVCTIMLSDAVVVVDRMILTQIVYRLYDGKSLDKCDFNWNQICTILNKRLTKIIYCCTPNAYEYSIARGEENIKYEYEAMEIQKLYNYVVRVLELYEVVPVYHYDFEKQTVQDVLNFIGGK